MTDRGKMGNTGRTLMVNLLPDNALLCRREFLRGSAAIVATAILMACGSSSSTSSQTTGTDAQATSAAIIASANATATAISGIAQSPTVPVSGTTLTQTKTATTAPLVSGGPQGYLASGNFSDGTHGVVFIQWTENGGSLVGQYQAYFLVPGTPPQFDSESLGFSGVR